MHCGNHLVSGSPTDWRVLHMVEEATDKPTPIFFHSTKMEMRILLHILSGLILIGSFFLLAACDSDSGQDEIDNVFSVSIDVMEESGLQSSVSLQGFSFFFDAASMEQGPDDEFFLVYFNDTQTLDENSTFEGIWGTAGRAMDRPAPGSYPVETDENFEIDDGPFRLFFFDFDESDIPVRYHLTDGELEITNSSSDVVEATFSGQGTRFSFDVQDGNPQEIQTPVQMEGTFTAERLDDFMSIGGDAPRASMP